MKCFIGLGSNLANRRENLEAAGRALRGLAEPGGFRLSPLYETPALMPEGAPPEWNIPYLNAVLQMEWSGTAPELLGHLKRIERDLGRTPAPRWAPRILDLDLLTFGDEIFHQEFQEFRESQHSQESQESLVVPHEGILKRSFVLDPLKDLAPGFIIPGSEIPAVVRARQLPTHTPLVMAIVNLTPDSFSDGGENSSLVFLEAKFKKMIDLGVQVLDLGAESTRPGAPTIGIEEEWRRLEPALKLLGALFKNQLFHPLLSVDTRHAATAERVLDYQIDWINDVSGGADPEMFEVLKKSSCDYVLMHSLTVPADPKVCLSSEVDPVEELKKWLHLKLEILSSKGIDLDRIIFDPGVGFGKTASQSMAILKRLEEFSELPLRMMIGHSRKSFMKEWGGNDPQERDAITLRLSLELACKGVDVLRVHDFESHFKVFRHRAENSPLEFLL